MPIPNARAVVGRSLLRDEAYRAVRDAIVDGTFAPGERLNDVELAGWLGISRTPIREALARLEQAGLVRTRPGRFTIVSPLDDRETLAAQQVAASMHELAVRLAVPLLSQDELTAMATANEAFATALRAGDAEAALAADDLFHGYAVSACGNELVGAVLEQTTPLLRRIERLRFESLAGRESVAQHATILELCSAGDAEAAALATRANWSTLHGLSSAGPVLAADGDLDVRRRP